MRQDAETNLERFWHQLPWGEIKDDPRPAYDAVVHWLASLDSAERREAIQTLSRWLRKRTNQTRYVAALEIALRVQDGDLLDAAVEVARSEGIPDSAAEVSGSMDLPFWCAVYSDLIRAIRSAPTVSGRLYLHDLAGLAAAASSPQVRELAIRARVAECVMHQENGAKKLCLERTLELLRSWSDPEITRAALVMLGSLMASNHQVALVAQPLLRPDEAKEITS
jgi:hypothetical protein